MKMNATLQDLITTNDAAVILGVTPSSVRRLAAEGKLPTAKEISGIRLFLRGAIERVAARRGAQRQKGTPRGRPTVGDVQAREEAQSKK